MTPHDDYKKIQSELAQAGKALDGASARAADAAADGIVINAGWMGGYGNYTCIRHGTYRGKGLGTCYGHQPRILVHVGQRVHGGSLSGGSARPAPRPVITCISRYASTVTRSTRSAGCRAACADRPDLGRFGFAR